MARKVDVGVLQRLSEMNGPAGFEGPVREYIADMAKGLGAKVEIDKMGNVHGHVSSSYHQYLTVQPQVFSGSNIGQELKAVVQPFYPFIFADYPRLQAGLCAGGDKDGGVAFLEQIIDAVSC